MSLLKSLVKRGWFIGLAITLIFLIFSEADLFSALDGFAAPIPHGLDTTPVTGGHEAVDEPHEAVEVA